METIYEIRKKMANGGDTIFEADKIIGNTNKSTDYEVLKTIANGGTKYECTVNKAKSLGITSDLPNRYEADKAIYNKLNANYTILVNHNNFGTIQFEVDGVVSTGNTITVRGGKTLKMTLVPDSTKQANYGEWQSASETTESTDLTKTIVVNENKTYLAWFGMESFDYATYNNWLPYSNLPFGVPIRRCLINRTVKANAYATFAMPFDVNLRSGANSRWFEKIYKMDFTKCFVKSDLSEWVGGFLRADTMKAGMPYFVPAGVATEQFVLDSFEYVTMKNTGNLTDEGTTTKEGYYRMRAISNVTEVYTLLPGNNYLYFSGASIRPVTSASGVKSQPGRTYMQYITN